MDAESLARLKRNLAAATDDSLVALANRGLVRRAAKDLQQAEAFVVEETDEAVLVRGDGWTVVMPPDGPAAATDDTPATGVTRQIVAATMHLREHWQASDAGSEDWGAGDPDAIGQAQPAVDEPADEAIQGALQQLLDASPGELFKWAGKTPLLEASAALGSLAEPVISHSPQLVVEFAELGVRVVLMTDRPARTLRRLLDQFKTTAKKSEHPRWVMLAVLALKRAAGQDTAVVSDPEAELTEAVRDDRRRIAGRAQRLLRSVAASGIAHPSSRIVERLGTAGVAAEAARFPRLARLLRSIADDMQMQIARGAAADPARTTLRMVVAAALAEAAARPENSQRGDLFGRPRTSYSPAGQLQLCGLGAYGWRTASGFEGLTAVFWDRPGQRFLTASVSRGQGQDLSFSIPQAYERGLGWSGGAAISTMCRSQLTLSDAKTNVEGRLSVSQSCRAEVGQATDPGGLDFGDCAVHQWSDVVRIVQRSQPIGLRQPDPRASYLVVRPQRWGQRWFDELEQAFVWQLLDEQGAALEVRVPWAEVDEANVAFLESLKVERENPTAVLGRLEVRGGALRVYPFSIFSSGTVRGDKILCPQFDQARIRSRNEALLQRLRKKFGRERRVETRIGDAEPDELSELPVDDLLDAPPALRAALIDVDQVFSAALESGSTRLAPAAADTLAAARDHLAALGAARLADALSEVLGAAGAPPDLLRAAYRLLLFRQSLRLCQVG